jgi:hypothetical protein
MEDTQLREQIRLLERNVRRNQRLMLLLSALCGVVTLAAFGPPWQKQRFSEIDVERINVIHRDGEPALVLANTDRLPPVIHGGRTVKTERKASGMLFYNGKGDEAGGLIYNSTEQNGRYSAGANLTFDQYDQDQVVQLTYQDNGSTPAAGLMITDRPTHLSIGDYRARREAVERATGEERTRLARELRAAEERGEFWAQRVFVGSVERRAVVSLKDTAGRTRLRLSVDSTNVARMEFLDERGQVVHRIPEK